MAALLLARVFVCAFFAVVMLQSGLDKVFDWKGNLGWLSEHFGKTVFRGAVPLLVATITLVELLAGLACAAGVIVLLLKGPEIVPLIGMSLVCLNLLMLIAGQRIAKDYAGAVSIASYFIVALFGLTLMGQHG